jgi:hypothetical protein
MFSFRKKTKDKVKDNTALNDSDMRDLIMSLIGRSNVNFANRYLKPTEAEIAERPELETWDGLIMRPEGCFRVAVEPETGIKVILFEFEPQHLTGAKCDDGSIMFSNLEKASAEEQPDIYRVGAFDPSANQTILQQAINNFCAELRNNIVPDLDLYLRDEAQYETDKSSIASHTFRAANKDMAFGLFHEDNGHWQSVMYSTLRGNHDNSGQFERIARHQRNNGTAIVGTKEKKSREIFRLSKENMKTADDFGGVLEHTLKYWGINSLKKFKGQNALSEAMTLRMIVKKKSLSGKLDYTQAYARQQVRKSVRWGTGFVGRRYKEYGISAVVSLALSVRSLPVTAAKTIVLAIAAGIGATVIGKYVDEQAQKGARTFFGSRSKYREMKAQLPKTRDYSRFFDAETPNNKQRPLKKIAPEFVKRLRLLSHAQSEVMHSMDKSVAVTRRDWKQQYLAGLETRMFGKVNMAISDRSVLKILPNGVVALTHMNEAFNQVSKYYTYNERFVSSKSAPLHDRIKDMLSNGVYKVTDEKGCSGLSAKQMRRSDFTKEIRKVYADVTDIDGTASDVPNILAKLFNPKANNNPHNRISELLSEAARVDLGKTVDPLEKIMALSKDLRDERKPKKYSPDEDNIRANTIHISDVSPPRVAHPSLGLL